MNKPQPHDIEALLRQDAARLRESDFDPALHHATLRKIRSLSERSHPLPHRPWVFSLAAIGVLLGLGFAAALWHPHQPIAQSSPTPSAQLAHPHSSPASAWEYRLAALQGDEALLARLDSDSRRLLTPTSPVFSDPHP